MSNVWLSTTTTPHEAWICGGTAVVVMFGPIQVSYQPGYGEVGLTDYARTAAKELGGYTAKVGDHAAAVIPSSGGDINHEVIIIVAGNMVRLMSERSISLEDVVALARSLELPPA